MVLLSSVLRGAIVALATVWLGSSLALAGRVPPHRNNNHPVQRPYRGEQKPKLDSVSIEGTITSEAPNGILVAANGKGGSKSWTVVRGPMTRIHVTGTPRKTLASHAEPKTHHRPEKADTPADAPADPTP